MGTSSSSKGPGKGALYDPPWINDILDPEHRTPLEKDENGNGEKDSTDTPKTPHTVDDNDRAPEGRFYGARRNLNHYIQNGSINHLRRALGQYSQTGMGGAKNVVRRMRLSTQTAAGLFSFLSAISKKVTTEIEVWVNSLIKRKLNPYEISEEIIAKIGKVGGSIDEESVTNSMTLAFMDLLLDHPTIDLLNLDEDSIWNLVIAFLGYEIFNRIYLDIGQNFEKSDKSPMEIENRKNEMREYIMADLFARIENERKAGISFTENEMGRIFARVLQHTFEVYEGVL